MNNLSIQTAGDYLNFYPGSILNGKVVWELDFQPTSSELRLFWFTQGNRSSTDTATIEVIQFPTPSMRDQRDFSLRLPVQPYSFKGELFSIHWALELVVQPGDVLARQQIVISATGYEITPQPVAAS